MIKITKTTGDVQEVLEFSDIQEYCAYERYQEEFKLKKACAVAEDIINKHLNKER